VLSSQLLGFPADARVLIVNNDDFGMDSAVNAAVVRSITDGIAASCSLMPPCPAAPEAMRLLRTHPEIPFGIHLTLVRDSTVHRWGPLAAKAEIPSLLDEAGELFTDDRRAELLARATVDDVERELRAQIDEVVDAGLTPTHLDWHCLADGGRADLGDLTTALAREYGLAARVWLDPARTALRRQGLPALDHPFLDSFGLDVDGKAERYARLLRGLPAGLSEWAVHPSTGGDPVRRTDYAFLTSTQARTLVAEEGITVIDYRPIQTVWATGRCR
jgi:predicted glycoside hydrolase/deacetylase ChbG (UPF0249 family)